MNNFLVTVTIPTYNSARTLEKTLLSVKNQTYQNIEISIVDSFSKDRTKEIAESFGAHVYQTEWKLLGARKIGVDNANGKYILLLDSDQILKPDTIERLVNKLETEDLDMLFLGERSYNPHTWLEKLFDLDRIYVHATYQADPIKGVLLPRFYKKELLARAFEPIPKKELEVCIAQDHAIIFYEASKLSNKVALLPDAVFHMEPSKFWDLVKKNYRYGKSMSELKAFKPEYQDMLEKKTRFREFDVANLRGYFASSIILLIKGAPYILGSKMKSEVFQTHDFKQLNWPKISFIIPVFNEEKSLESCLENLFALDYPLDKMEILVIDNQSTDNTVAIARAKHCEVIINERRGATFGKALGLKQATGKFVYFHEADVRFSTSMWLKEMVSPLILDQEAFGAECDWGIAKDFGSLNTYCALLQIADPLARMLSRQKPRRTYLRNGYLIKEFNPGDNPIMHCFLWRRSTIEIIPDWNDEFAEAKFFSAIIAEGRTEFIHINSTFANHYYVDTLGQFLRKRKKIARQFLIRNQNKPSWASRRSPLIFLLSVVYLGTFIGPLVEAIYGYAKTGRREWFWHPIVSFLTIAVYVFNFRKY